MKRSCSLLLVLLVFLLASPLFAGGSQEGSEGSAVSDGPYSGWKVASLMPSPINDGGFSASAFNGLKEIEALGAEIAYSDSVAQADAESIMSEYAIAGYDIVMASGYEFDDALINVSEKYPDTKFVQIDGGVVNDINLYSYGYMVGEGGYLLGLIAGSLTKVSTVGLLAGGTDPAMVWEFVQAKKGILNVNPDAKIMEAYVGSWDDPVKARELAQGQIEAGADVIISVTDVGDIGVISAAQEAYDNGLKNMRDIGWGEDKNSLAPDIFIPGWTTANARLMKEAMDNIVTAGAPAGHYVFGLQDGVVGLLPFHGLVPADVEALINKTIKDYKAGTLELEIRSDF